MSKSSEIGNVLLAGKISHSLTLYPFQGLTNWGKGAIEANLNPDENSVIITAFFQVCGGLASSVEEVEVFHELKALSEGTASEGESFTTAGLSNVIKVDPLAANDQVQQ